MTAFIFTIVYLAFGFMFMTTCAKFGWMHKYDPPFFYWFCWPMVIVAACFKVLADAIVKVNSALENYVNTLKPVQDENVL